MSSSQAMNSHSSSDKTMFGFWMYIMTDCMLFATLFATYAVLRNNTAGGPSGSELFSLPFVLIETLILLTSSFTIGLSLLAAHRGKKNLALTWLIITGVLGLVFIGMELHEFSNLVHEGYDWQRSAFLSAFFTLVGTHGLHISVGLIWISVVSVYIAKRGLTGSTVKRLGLLSMFWHFLDIVWIFIFTIVYLLGATQ